MQFYKPSEILIEKDALSYDKTEEILQKFPDIPHIEVENYDWRTDTYFENTEDILTHGKKRLYLKVYKGAPVKLCPGYSPNVVCCNYHIVDFVENCPSECIYCVLQAVQNRPVMTVHVNANEIIEWIASMIASNPEKKFRIGTGEFSDSLSMDHIANVNTHLVETFGKLPNALLELKSKCDFIEPLLNLNHNGQTVVSWSIGTEHAGKMIELKTASPKKRIDAAGILAGKGYHVAFHLDPIIVQENAEQRYRDIIRYIQQTVSADKIGWFSMGSLRFMPKLKTIAEKRFPKTDIFSSDFVDLDGKQRYFKPVREKLYVKISRLLNEYFPDVPLYMCMESSQIWKNVLNNTPVNPSDTEQRITRRFNLGGCNQSEQTSQKSSSAL